MPRAWLVVTVALGLVAAGSCTDRTSGDPPEDERVPHRIEPCQELCEALLGECGPFPDDDERTIDDCVFECATLEGDLSWGWGYQYATDVDACAPEWQAHTDCLLSLSCEDFQIYWRDVAEEPPFEERSCYDAFLTMTSCVHAHPCCGDT